MSKKKTASLGMFTRIVGSQGFVSVLSVLIAFAIGAILIAATGASVTDAYYAMFRGPSWTRRRRRSCARLSR